MKPNNILSFYQTAKEKIIKAGFHGEIEVVEKRKFNEQTSNDFFNQYIFVVCNSGMKNQAATRIFTKYFFKGLSAINHLGKRKAIAQLEKNYKAWFNQLKSSNDKISYLESLPFIGKITKFHLARNLGLDVAKPDRWLTRLALHFGYDNVHQFCKTLSEQTGDRIGTVDVVLWRYCNLFPNTVKKEILKE